jgi:hypothetical protein
MARQENGRRSARQRKSGPVHDAIERAVKEELRGVPAADNLQHLQDVGLDADTARLIYAQVRQRVIDARRRMSFTAMIAGACVLVVGLALLLAMTIRWPETGYLWRILAGLLSVCGLGLLVGSHNRLRRERQHREP